MRSLYKVEKQGRSDSPFLRVYLLLELNLAGLSDGSEVAS